MRVAWAGRTGRAGATADAEGEARGAETEGAAVDDGTETDSTAADELATDAVADAAPLGASSGSGVHATAATPSDTAQRHRTTTGG